MKNKKNSYSFTKKIGKATYQVHIRFSENSKEHFNDKLLRLIKNEIAQNTKAG